MDCYTETNRDLWNEWTKLHRTTISDCYDLPAFRAGRSTLKHVEIEELGDVSGKSLLHLQCHFGMDTLSWARCGARVTGVDFSDEAIALARSLSVDLCIPAEFICADIMQLSEALNEQRFDVVFTSYGVLAWLRDLDRWARGIVRHLRPGGIFYLVEFHPLLGMLDDDGERFVHPYFGGEVERCEVEGSYGAPTADLRHTAYEWSHSMAEVVTALVAVGLKLEFLHEFPYSTYSYMSFFDQKGPERFVVHGLPQPIPHMFSIRAARPA